MPDYKRLKLADFKATDEAGTFRATFSTFNVVDKDGDVTLPGAFKEGQEVRIAQWGHAWHLPVVGKGVVHADEEKAWVDGAFFIDMIAGNETYKSVKGLGSLQEWSYGYEIEEYSFGKFADEQVRFLKALNTIEISPVMLGAGIGTQTDAIKSGLSLGDESDAVLAAVKGLSSRLRSLAELRGKEGRSLSTANVSRLKGHRDALSAIVADLDELLANGDPKGLTMAEIIEIEKVRARLLGVAV